MKYLKSLTICTLVLALDVFGQTNRPEKHLAAQTLERQVQGSDLEYLTTTSAFYVSLSRAGAVGGMARIQNCEEDSLKQAWSPMNQALRLVLDSLVQADSRYRWQIDNQVINLLPTAGEPTLLQTRINKFRVKNVASATEALGQLMALPEVRKAMEDLKLKQGIALYISSKPSHPELFSVKCEGVSLRQALNAIARAQGKVLWEYVEIHCDGRNEVVIRF